MYLYWGEDGSAVLETKSRMVEEDVALPGFKHFIKLTLRRDHILK
jgi:hypothetical protein